MLFFFSSRRRHTRWPRDWSSDVCSSDLSLGLKGRVIVSKDGINATVGGDVFDVKQYVRATKSYAPFKKADIKWSNGQGDDFPRLSVKVRPELVTFGTPDEIKVTDDGVQGGGEHLKQIGRAS